MSHKTPSNLAFHYDEDYRISRAWSLSLCLPGAVLSSHSGFTPGPESTCTGSPPGFSLNTQDTWVRGAGNLNLSAGILAWIQEPYYSHAPLKWFSPLYLFPNSVIIIVTLWIQRARNTTQKQLMLMKIYRKIMSLSYQNPTLFWASETSHQHKNENTQASQNLAKFKTHGRWIFTRGVVWFWSNDCSQTEPLRSSMPYLFSILGDKAYMHFDAYTYIHLTRHLICTTKTQ